MGYAGPKAVSKVNMILKDKGCGLPAIKGLGNPLKKKKKPSTSKQKSMGAPAVDPTSSGIYKKGCKYGKK